MGTSYEKRAFVPAFGFDWMTPLYEPMMRIVQPIRRQLVERARIEPGMSVLDFGSGPGQLALLIKEACPSARVVGVDVDPRIREIAARQVAAAGVDVEFLLGTLQELDLAPNSFDRILTGFVLHHLTTEEKLTALSGLRELLRPEGQLHIVDLSEPRDAFARLGSYGYRWTHGSDRIAANLEGRIPALLRDAGFTSVEESPCYPSMIGLAFWHARG